MTENDEKLFVEIDQLSGIILADQIKLLVDNLAKVVAQMNINTKAIETHLTEHLEARAKMEQAIVDMYQDEPGVRN